MKDVGEPSDGPLCLASLSLNCVMIMEGRKSGLALESVKRNLYLNFLFMILE